jgi:hypothetical protein
MAERETLLVNIWSSQRIIRLFPMFSNWDNTCHVWSTFNLKSNRQMHDQIKATDD